MRPLQGLLAAACLTAAAIAARAPPEPVEKNGDESSATVDLEMNEKTNVTLTATAEGGSSTIEPEKTEGESSAIAEGGISTRWTTIMDEKMDDNRSATAEGGDSHTPAENITCGPIEAGATSITIPAETEALLSLGMCFTLAGGHDSEIVCVAGLGPMKLVSPTQFAHPAGSTLTLLEGVTAASNTTLLVHVTDENRSAFVGWVGWASAKTGKSTTVSPQRWAGLLPSEIAAEFIATMLFVIVGCGSACGIADKEGSAWVLQVALTFGLAITMLKYTIGHYSGGQINCAVTFGLVLANKLGPLQGFLYFLAQLGGSVAGALVLRVMYSDANKDQTGSLGSNYVNLGFSIVSALLGEIVGTFVLMYVVMEVEVNPMSQANHMVAPLAIGFAVFLAHSVLIPIDGCSINPTRSLGPALVATATLPGGKNHFMDMWVFCIGPPVGAALAVGVYSLMVASA